jgi:hypothetical protein
MSGREFGQHAGKGAPGRGSGAIAPVFRGFILALVQLLLLPSLSGKPPVLKDQQFLSPPARIIRTCCTFGVDLKLARMPFLTRTDVIDRDALGRHHFLGGHPEGNGIIYTRRGGFIDIGHLRDIADWTGYLFHLINFSADAGEAWIWPLGSDGGEKTLRLAIPAEMDLETRAQLAGAIAYDLALWHEMATWFGASTIPLLPERYSSFSPEDLYSNLLGAQLGVQAILSELDFEEAMTFSLLEILDTLEAVPSAEWTRLAMESVESIWWSRDYTLPSSRVLLAHYFDRPEALRPMRLPEDEIRIRPWILQKSDPALSEYYLLSIELKRLLGLALSLCGPPHFRITHLDFPRINHCIETRSDRIGRRRDRRKR